MSNQKPIQEKLKIPKPNPLKELVVAQRQNNLCATLQQIADRCGITREYVRRILASQKLPTRHWHINSYICNNCGKIFPAAPNRGVLFCCSECRQNYRCATLECEYCGKLYSIPYKDLSFRVKRGQLHFCCSSRCSCSLMHQLKLLRTHLQNNYP